MAASLHRASLTEIFFLVLVYSLCYIYIYTSNERSARGGAFHARGAEYGTTPADQAQLGALLPPTDDFAL